MTEILDRFVALDEEGRPMDFGRLPGREALAGRAPDPVLMRSISKATGDDRWMLVKATPVRDDEGTVVMAVNIMEDVSDARRAEHHQRFLAAASKLLSSSLDVDATLERAAAAIVPELADWCCVDVPDDRGRLQRRAHRRRPAARRPRSTACARGVRPRGRRRSRRRRSRDGRPRLHADSTTQAAAPVGARRRGARAAPGRRRCGRRSSCR